ncbi:52_t:CDS:2 [Acaulospora morrowiae]|uniref:52_t:CDS:1 n=1 Tax=Acaulospora morrowiae TaxID=94023 RepID=A0A9N9BSF2_9GLOM|nr:52_t:CDS:2 [Acaulospora morrowiae]
MVYLFDVPAYFILLRETLEATIILSVLLSFIDKLVPEQDLRISMKKQIWIGAASGLFISLVIGAAFIGIFYTLSRNLWEDSEKIWEGAFSLVASIVITIMALSMIKITHWKKKWERKLLGATKSYLQESNKGSKFSLIFLPFTTVCREALESVVFMAGIGFGKPATGLPIPIILGILTGFIIGWLIFRGSHMVSLRIFLICTTIFLLFMAAGLFTTSIDEFQEATNHPGIQLWSLNCCDPENDDFWQIMHAIFGWDNESTVGTFLGYFIYWIVVIIAMLIIRRRAAKKEDLENPDETILTEYISDEKPTVPENNNKSTGSENGEDLSKSEINEKLTESEKIEKVTESESENGENITKLENSEELTIEKSTESENGENLIESEKLSESKDENKMA